jgi:glucuronoarabinoxylan endo-1,4-beta-xylanase
MSATTRPSARGLSLALFGALALACEPNSVPQTTDSQTNWLLPCQIDSQCGDLRCVCGVCTMRCGGDEACQDLAGSSCVPAGEAGPVALCGGTDVPALGLCLPGCSSNAACADGQMCVAGVCSPVPEANADVEIETSSRHQSMIGFGATIAYGENEILGHPQRNALDQAMFANLGLDVLRLRIRYGHGDDPDLGSTLELMDAATASLGRTPTLLLTSWSPPVALKQNGDAQCSGNHDTCTLTRAAGGGFDYAGLAAYLRGALEAYAALGIVPDYLGIQNNPDWIPSSAELGEACRFAPVEGPTTVATATGSITVNYPGFAEAMEATLAEISTLASPPKILAPETSNVSSVTDYATALDMARVDAIAHHFYGTDPQAIDIAELGEVATLGNDYARPVLQTEMQSDGFGTALLIHHALSVGGAAAYLQTTMTGTAGPSTNPMALIDLGAAGFALQGAYFAMRHYARYTDPGWVRVGATSGSEDLLASAYLSPAEDSLTIVLVNAGATSLDVGLTLDTPPASSRVYRTVFGGAERFADLGALSRERIVTVPSRGIVTIAITQ